MTKGGGKPKGRPWKPGNEVVQPKPKVDLVGNAAGAGLSEVSEVNVERLAELKIQSPVSAAAPVGQIEED